MLAHGYKVIVNFKDGSVAEYEYSKEKVADSVVRSLSKEKAVASVNKEEF